MTDQRGTPTDPGWKPVFRRLPLLLVPVLGMRAMALNRSGLDSLRMVWLTLAHAMVLLWLPVLLIGGSGFGLVGSQAAVVVAAVVGVVAQLFAPRLAPELDPTTPRNLVDSFQRATLTRIGLAQFALAVGLLGFLASGGVAAYAVGFVIAAAGMADAAPTRRHLVVAQAKVDQAESGLDLRSALIEQRLGR